MNDHHLPRHYSVITYDTATGTQLTAPASLVQSPLAVAEWMMAEWRAHREVIALHGLTYTLEGSSAQWTLTTVTRDARIRHIGQDAARAELVNALAR